MRQIAAYPTAQRDLAEILETARSLQRWTEAGTTRPLLRGRRFGLMQGPGTTLDSVALQQAIVELGGDVSHLRTNPAELEDPRIAQRTAKMLERLYSAVICAAIDPSIVRRLRTDCNIPVHADVTSTTHVVSQVTALLDCRPGSPWFALQALLLRSIQ